MLSQHRADGAQRQERQREADGLHLVGEQELFHGRAFLAAVLLGPAEPEQPVPSHLLHCVAELGATALEVRGELRLQLVGHHLREIGAQLVTETKLLPGEFEVHDLGVRFPVVDERFVVTLPEASPSRTNPM